MAHTVSSVVKKNGSQYAVMSDGVGIPFEVLGPNNGIPVLVTPGGKQGRGVAKTKIAKDLADAGYKVLIHDRRNGATADFGIGDGTKTEVEMQVDDTLALMRHLDMLPAFFTGTSNGARLGVLAYLKEPESVAGLVITDMTGGKKAADFLSNEYHLKFIKPAKTGGMKEVLKTDFFQAFVKANPCVEQSVLDTDVNKFLAVQKTSGDKIKGSAEWPVIGLTKEQLNAINCPTLCIWGRANDPDDGMHTLEVNTALAKMIPGNTEPEIVLTADDHPVHEYRPTVVIRWLNQVTNNGTTLPPPTKPGKPFPWVQVGVAAAVVGVGAYAYLKYSRK
mmetsp:Transcript_39147/g.47388  ORF Transcript_39147/g.47388 Transcript_39147/m.47388 type:complete len:333 (+) Transcript_39147:76-1074(+)|eukprot:CAMPEP_0197849266 /NCGR_PEP_ID=MMETSP1438-20131217/11423_1 /TAXON_ID=1461541 /ORGANISM="Pterosperma sp., Strain CCMP1384" /LENGTH=332 /DNA_ID=CAMNT_0043461857 /DNA_START=60 /DNA_END=1058 /DNA_ORIENTATION=+